MTDKVEGGLTEAETAFFESGGTAEIPQTEEKAHEEGQEGLQAEAEGLGEQEKEQDGQARDDKGRFVPQVPHSVFHAEREEHKKTRAQLEEARAFKAAMEERMRLFEAVQQQGQQPQAEEDPAPDPNQDIFAFVQWQQRQYDKLQSKLSEREQAEQQARQQQSEDTAIWSHWQQSATAYEAEKPDFKEATKYLSELRDKHLEAYAAVDPSFGTPQARINQINAELRQIVLAARQQNRNPAEVVYQIASSYGYAPAQAQPEKVTLPGSLANVAAAQGASKTIGQASGRSSGDPLSADSIANMPESDFAEWIKVPENARRFERMMRGG